MQKERISCPPLSLSKEERIHYLLDEIDKFVSSPYLSKLVENFGDKIPDNLNLIDKVEWLNKFVEENWDYRAKYKDSERWSINNEQVENSEQIIDLIQGMGLIDEEEPLEKPDDIVIPGGFIVSNYFRPQLAKKVVDNNGLENSRIISLSTYRDLSEKERIPGLDYADNATTEYESLTLGTREAFRLGKNYLVWRHTDDNPYLRLEFSKFDDNYNNNNVYSIAAPSTDPSRRANSRDTFEFYIDNFEPNGKNVLMITTNLYVPYQLLAFIDLAIDYGFYVDCIGYKPKEKQNPALFLQELKAAVNQAYRIVEKYKDFIG